MRRGEYGSVMTVTEAIITKEGKKLAWEAGYLVIFGRIHWGQSTIYRKNLANQ